MNFSKKTILAGLLVLIMLALVAVPAFALDLTGEHLEKVRGEAQYGETDLVATVGRIIKLVLGFIGLIALIIFIVGGFMWMSSGGDEEKIASAKKLMSAAVVGIFIIIIAYAATAFVISKLQGVTEEECTPGYVKCVYEGTNNTTDKGKYATCQSNKTWGAATDCSNAGTALVCKLGKIAANAASICDGQQ